MAESKQNFFKARRTALKLSLSEIVYRMHPRRITIGAVSGWERGQVPSLDLVDDIARAYELTPRRVLDAMHEMAQERVAEKATAAAKA